MARPERAIFRATDLEGRTLEPNARLLLRLLWDKVKREAAIADREGGSAPEVPFTKQELMDELDVTPSTLDAHLRRLHDTWWIRRVRVHRDLHVVAVLRPERRDAALVRLGTSIGKLDDSKPDRGFELTYSPNSRDPRPPENSGRSSREFGPGSREFGEILPNSRAPLNQSTFEPIGVVLTGSNAAPPRDHAREGDNNIPSRFVAKAIEILSEAIPPLGAWTIPATTHGARFLAARLAEGWPELEARRLLVAAPAIVARRIREPRWYRARMFEGEILDHWLNARAQLELLEEEDAREAANRSAAEQRERDEVARLNREAATNEAVRALEGEDKFAAIERLGAETLSRWGVSVGTGSEKQA